MIVTADEVLGKLPTALAAMDQPSIDGANTYIVSEAVANAGLKVAISGLGETNLCGLRLFSKHRTR